MIHRNFYKFIAESERLALRNPSGIRHGICIRITPWGSPRILRMQRRENADVAADYPRGFLSRHRFG